MTESTTDPATGIDIGERRIMRLEGLKVEAINVAYKRGHRFFGNPEWSCSPFDETRYEEMYLKCTQCGAAVIINADAPHLLIDDTTPLDRRAIKGLAVWSACNKQISTALEKHELEMQSNAPRD